MPWQLTFEYFTISETRAVHKDTDYVAVNISINGVHHGPQIRQMGNLNNGDYAVNFDWIIDNFNSNDEIVFAFLIVNHGGDKAANVEAACSTALTQTPLIQFYPPDAVLTQPIIIDGINTQTPLCMVGDERPKEFMDILWQQVSPVFKHLSTNRCDGCVVIDRFSFYGSSVTSVEQFWHAIKYDGLDSRDGCGHNSKYTALWSISGRGCIDGVPVDGSARGC